MTTITLDREQMALLDAVNDGRVHHDPRFRAPDFERTKADDPLMLAKRVTQRMKPLKKWKLVQLAAEAGAYGIRLYELTETGRQARDAYRDLAEREVESRP